MEKGQLWRDLPLPLEGNGPCQIIKFLKWPQSLHENSVMNSQRHSNLQSAQLLFLQFRVIQQSCIYPQKQNEDDYSQTNNLQKCSIGSPSDFDLVSSVSLGDPGVLKMCHLPTAEHLPACLSYHGTIVYTVALVCGKHLPSSLLSHRSYRGRKCFCFTIIPVGI